MKEQGEKHPSYFVKLCAGKAAYEARFSRSLHLDMSSIEEAFKTSNRFEVVLSTPHLIIIRMVGKSEITVSRDGRMLIKDASSKRQAEIIVENVLKVALSPKAEASEMSASQ